MEDALLFDKVSQLDQLQLPTFVELALDYFRRKSYFDRVIPTQPTQAFLQAYDSRLGLEELAKVDLEQPGSARAAVLHARLEKQALSSRPCSPHWLRVRPPRGSLP